MVAATIRFALAVFGLLGGDSSYVSSFAGLHKQHRSTTSTSTITFHGNCDIHRRNRQPLDIISALSASGDNKEDDDDSLLNDQREGMADAFAGLDSLNADDFDDLKPPPSSIDTFSTSNVNAEESAKLFMEMQAELSTEGDEGVYDSILGDLSSGDDIDAPNSYMNTAKDGDVTSLTQALDEAVESPSDMSSTTATSILNDADGLGATDSPTDNTQLTTGDVSNDILTQDIKPSMSMDEFISTAMQEAVSEVNEIEESYSETSPSTSSGDTAEIAKTAEQLLEDEELRKEIESIFDKAGEKLRLEVEAMKKEQEAVTQSASKRGLEYLESEKQRISEAEESVSRLIQTVASRTDEVQKAMEEVEEARNEAKGDTAVDSLKRGGIVKQAALVGGLLFGSRAFTETILVFNSPYGNEHFVPAIVQAAITLVCVAYLFFMK